MDNVILSKTSGSNELKRYFMGVLEVSKSGKEFPVNLDEVSSLVYGKKSDAVEALCKNFIQDVDYQVLRQNPQNLSGGRPTNIYMLTVSCMEFFIARKVRAVFEVYRQVFHKALAMPTDYPSALRALANQVEANQRLELQNVQQQKAIEVMLPKADFADQAFRLDSRINIGTCGKVLGLPFGRTTLFRKLRERGVFFSNRNEPKQKFVDAGYFVMGEHRVRNGGGDFMVNVTYATQKGLAYIGYLFGKKPNEEDAARLFAQAMEMDNGSINT